MIAILISTYNGEKYICKQLDSIFEQTYKQFHIYIRDDGSVDSTVSVINDYIRNNSLEDKITVVSGRNIGFCKSFRKLLEMSKDEDYWAFCDQDDFWLPNKLEFALEMLNDLSDEKPVMYFACFDYVDECLNFRKTYNPHYELYTFEKSLTSSICYGFTCVINGNLREKLLRCDWGKIQSHDWFASMISMAFGQLIYDPRIVALHRLHVSNDSPNSIKDKIKRGYTLFGQESFYTLNVREFYRIYSGELSQKQQKFVKRFLNYRYDIPNMLFKVFYPHRWNDDLLVEIVIRLLMLIGKI